MNQWQIHTNHPDDRAAMVDWANAVVFDSSAVFLDTETTGVGPSAEIVDIAVLDAGGLPLLDTLVKPTRPIPADSSQIHGIYDHHVEDAPRWNEVFSALTDVIGQRRVVVYNVDYDQGVIAQCCSVIGMSLPLSRWDCAMKAYAAFVGEPSTHSRGGYRWIKLGRAAAAFGIEPGGHRAAADAEACRLVVHAMARVQQ
ncbi:exonuclease domain-containing protein [soil metagenome]